MDVRSGPHHTEPEMAYLPLSLDREQSDGLRFKQLLTTLQDSALGIQHYSGPEQYSSVQTFREALEQTENAIASLAATNQQLYEEIERLKMTNKETEATELKKKLAQLNEELTMWRRAGTLRCRSKPCQEVFMTFQALKNHEKCVHNIGAERFSCPYCSKTYVKKPSFDEHLRRCEATVTNQNHFDIVPAVISPLSQAVYTTSANQTNSFGNTPSYHSLTGASLSPPTVQMTPSSQLEFQFQPNDSIATFSSSQLGPGIDNAGAFAPELHISSAEGYSPGESTPPPHYILSPTDQRTTCSIPMFTEPAWRPEGSLDHQYQLPLAPVTTQVSEEASRALHFLRPGQITLSRRQSAPACSLPLMPGENPPFRLNGPPPPLPSHLSVAVASPPPPPASLGYTEQQALSLTEEQPQMTFHRVGDKKKGRIQIAQSNIIQHNTCFTSGAETRSYGAAGGWSNMNYANTGFGM
ncbi:hypothetical protein GE21DRAFT_612 [Neurospora crassa]|uniref:C2H2-type domain-containing protein n=1 Tax=Neurospora crassa (strain ATCC 24698 / 74-OR23-1A / CBS 708.71 / DSM 1257 / FGSC 987) TaxID=367110 RepID=Q7S0L5_NEUCR|nr:hypothetical protein NCU09971 [Neurospora crassa OR74A]EAA28853.2 hypothetical protein NCU09971 [Neurospora crassa OR74A]KHE80914.1 hypothetical protein GE21DRAFT_612 [Neurospora crassa]|eukprot:XP_958089.2 hypothetical protein NCU09971 [Neurospora crassa OR74A]